MKTDQRQQFMFTPADLEAKLKNRHLAKIPDWLHKELQRRAHLQWEAMQAFMHFDPATKRYNPEVPVELTKFEITPKQLEVMTVVRSIYNEPIIDPKGRTVELTDKIFAWWDEYAMQFALFPDPQELNEVKRLTASFYLDGKRFSLDRWFGIPVDPTIIQQSPEKSQLN